MEAGKVVNFANWSDPNLTTGVKSSHLGSSTDPSAWDGWLEEALDDALSGV